MKDPTRPSGLMANAGAVFASRIVVAVLGWSGTILIIRNLSGAEWGQFTFVFGFLGLVATLSNVVNSRVAIHGLLKDDADRFAGSYVLLRLLLGLLAYCVAVTIVVVANYPDIVVKATVVGGFALILATPSVAYDAIFQARQRMDRPAIAAIVGQLAQFVLTALLALSGSSMVAFTVPAVLCEIVVIALKLRWVRPLQRVRYVPDTQRWRTMLRASIPLAIGGGLASAYYSIDAVMLSRMDTFRAVGTYGIAYKFAGIVSFVPVAMNAAVLTLLVTSWPSDLRRFQRSLQRAGTTVFLVAVIVVVEFMLFSGDAIRLLYGDAYASAANATRLVIAGECLGFFTTLGVTTFAAMSRNRVYPIAALVGLVFNVVANLVLIPEYSFRGAAWATLATEIIVVSIIWIPLARTVGFRPVPRSVAVPGSVAGALAAGAGLGAGAVMPWFIAALVTAMVFVVVVYVAPLPDRGGIVALLRDDDRPVAGGSEGSIEEPVWP